MDQSFAYPNQDSKKQLPKYWILAGATLTCLILAVFFIAINRPQDTPPKPGLSHTSSDTRPTPSATSSKITSMTTIMLTPTGFQPESVTIERDSMLIAFNNATTKVVRLQLQGQPTYFGAPIQPNGIYIGAPLPTTGTYEFQSEDGQWKGKVLVK